MRFTVFTQFPEMFENVLNSSILERAKEKGLISFNVINIRAYTKDKHTRTDDTPFGGGFGMVMSPQPAFDALRENGAEGKKVLYMSPRGKMLSKSVASSLATEDEVFILCGHYEGVDQRIIDAFKMEEVSIGDYILTGGELPAMVLIDTVTRLIPGVLSSEDSSYDESIYSGLLEADMYTKPREYEGMEVPEVLFSGKHKLIHLWKFEKSLKLTKERRPDLFEAFLKSEGVKELTKEERKVLDLVLSTDKNIDI